MRKLNWFGQVRAQLFLVLVGLYVIIPLWALLNVALDTSIVGPPLHFSLFPVEPSLDHFVQVWRNPYQSLSFLDTLRNSLIVSVSASALAVAFGVSSAYAFARFRFPGQKIGLFGLLLGTLLPPVALMTPLYILLSAFGIRTTLLGLIVSYAAFTIPFCLWNMRNAFQAVPRDLEEAAFIDGADQWTAFLRVSLPLALPSIAVAALLGFLFGYTEFAIAWLFVQTEDTVTLAMAVIALVGRTPEWGRQAALALMMSLPVLLIFLLLRRYLLSGALLGFAHGEEGGE